MGTKTYQGGHAILYEFCKNAGNTYDIYLYNTGKVIQYQIQRNGTLFYQAAIKFENIFPEELDLSPQNSTFRYLAELQIPGSLEKRKCIVV